MNPTTELNDYEQLAQRVSRTVERENRRRGRAVRLFFVLLLVPLAAAVAILLTGMTDTEWVRENARVAVESDLKAVRKTAHEIGEVLPEVKEAVSKVEETNRRVEVVEQRQAENFESQQGGLMKLEEQQRVTKNRVNELAQIPMAARDPRVDQLLKRLDVMEGQLDNTRRELIRMKEVSPASRPEDLDNRLRRIEGQLQQIRRTEPVR